MGNNIENRVRVIVHSQENLADFLVNTGYALDVRCGGRGTCARCGVSLIKGTWEVEGRTVEAPADALSCRTRLLSDCGEVEFTPFAGTGKINAGWNSLPLTNRPETVIGIDLGTTTIAAVKIRAGKIVGSVGCFNAQAKYGDNVVTRINAAASNLSGLKNAVRESVDDLLAKLGTGDVDYIAVAGNTVMSCLFHGIDPMPIGTLPFTPPLRCFPETDWNGIPLLTMPCIAGYVGGDLTAGIYETRLARGEMLVDIGTNCEIVFNTPSGIFCTAAAAGPAFEGAGLHFGSRAVTGAIDHYLGKANYSVLGDVEAQGFCGSAFIDFLAVERQLGHLNEFGRYHPKAQMMSITDKVFIHEYDIEQLLKAKAAVWAGIKTLEEYCHRKADRIYLAGGFAQYLDLQSAIAIGMLPEREYRIVGNTSLGGAARLAISPELLPELEKIIDLPHEIPLNTLAEFEDNFIDGLLLP